MKCKSFNSIQSHTRLTRLLPDTCTSVYPCIGNKRIAKSQAHDQKLTNMNLALARNCNAVINKKDGATAVDWKAGIPVRVLRSSKLGLNNKYAPRMEDFRYFKSFI